MTWVQRITQNTVTGVQHRKRSRFAETEALRMRERGSRLFATSSHHALWQKHSSKTHIHLTKAGLHKHNG